MSYRRTVPASVVAATIVIAVIGSCTSTTDPGGGQQPVPSAATSTVALSASNVASGSGVTATLQARDANGASIATGGATVAFSLGGAGTSGGSFGPVTDNGNGTYTATFTGTIAGSARSIAATINGAAVTTTMPSITVIPGPAAAANSLVEVSSASIQVGATATLTLRARDAALNALTSGGLIVAFTKGAGTSDGTIGAVTDNGNGTYTATFTATTAGTARSIGATIGGSALTSTPPTITVTPPPVGPASPATSLVTLSAATVASGANVTITMQVKDAAGVNHTTGGAAVAFALAGAGTSTATIGPVADNNNGTYTATLAGVLAGTARNVSATMNGAAVTTTQPSFTVTPGTASPATSLVSVSAPSVLNAGVVTLTLTARDAAGNSQTSGGLTVVFTKGSGTSDGTIGTTTDNGNGTYTATFTATTIGTARSIGATIGGVAVTTASPTITVVPPTSGPPSPATSVVTISPTSLASGTNATVTLQARDAGGVSFTTGGAVVTFALAGGGTSTGTISPVTDNDNGTYTATLAGVVAGTARNISATLNAAAVTTTQPSFTVTPGAVSLSSSLVTVSSPTVATGNPVTLTLTAKDAAGNPLASGGLAVLFTKGLGTSDGVIGVVTDNANGTYTATFAATTPGTARSIGATIGGNAVTSVSPTITVTAPVVSAATSVVTVNNATIQSGTTSTITLQAKDASGADITNGGANVTFGLGSGSSTGTIGSVTDNNNGTYTAIFTGVLIGTPRSVTATVNGDAVTTAQPTITVTPGAISVATSTVGVSPGSIASGTTSTLTLTTRDAAGNSLTTGGATIAFGLGGSGTSAGTIGGVTDNGNGTYTATFTGTTAGTARAITATINSVAVTTTAPTITVNPGALSLATSQTSVSLANVEMAGTSTLTLTARDAAGNQLATGGSTVAFSTTAGANPSTGTIGSVTDNGNGTYSATFTATGAGTPLTVNATVGGNAVTSPKPTLLVYVKGITLTTTSITANATQGLAGGTHLIGVFANGSQTAAGLQASIAYTSPGVGLCQSANWLGTPTFDFTTATPFSILTINPTAVGLGIYTCTATITISSNTPGIASQQFTVSLAVARTTVAQTAVNLIFMGLNSQQDVTQQLVPDAKILITNGGRGIMTGLHATVTNQQSNGVDTAWMNNTHLSWENDVAPADSNNRTAPRTLLVHAQVRPQNATAILHVSATGMPTIDIPLNVFFNINLEIVTNPRGLTFNAFAGGPSVAKQVLTFNQNRLTYTQGNDSLRHFEVVPASLPTWLTANVVPLTHQGMDTAATITFTANPTGLLADSVLTANVTVRAEICRDNFDGTCQDDNSFDTFAMPVVFVIERGLVVPVANATIFAAEGTATVDRDIAITNGGSTTLSGLSANVGGAAWLSASFVGGVTTAPATLRLTANPTGFARGTVLNTTVTVSSTTPGTPPKSFPVTFRVY